MVAKLVRHSPFNRRERDALLLLPHRLSKLGRRQLIVREGDTVNRCCLLLSGFASCFKLAGKGNAQMLSIHLRGDLIDLDNSIVGIADCSIETLTEAEVAFIPRQALTDIAASYPAIGRSFLKEAVIDGAIIREWLLNVGQRNARERISHLLCELAVRQGTAGISNGQKYAWPMTQEQVGQATGITPVHVNRTVQSLRAEVLIELDSRNVTILNWERPQKAGDFQRAYLHDTQN